MANLWNVPEPLTILLLMTKTEKHLMIWLDLGYVLHHCNPKKQAIFLYDVTECVNLRGEKICEIGFDRPQHGS